MAQRTSRHDSCQIYRHNCALPVRPSRSTHQVKCSSRFQEVDRVSECFDRVSECLDLFRGRGANNVNFYPRVVTALGGEDSLSAIGNRLIIQTDMCHAAERNGTGFSYWPSGREFRVRPRRRSLFIVMAPAILCS